MRWCRSRFLHKDFEKEVFPLILAELSKMDLYYTKTRGNPNWVKVCGREVYVKTKKSSSEYKLIPHAFFTRTWELLCDKGRVTQNELSKQHHIKRSAFILIAFDLLDFVEYDSCENGLKLKQIS